MISHRRKSVRTGAILLGFLLFVVRAQADAVISSTAPVKPKIFDFITKVPGDLKDYGKDTFQKKNAPTIFWLTALTGVLIIGDQRIVDHAQHLGDKLGITHTPYQKTIARIGFPGAKTKLEIEGPFDSGSALYFLGDGWTDVAIAGSFLTVGLVKSDNRALQTASQMAEAIIGSGAVVQTLKHITGRESPFTSTEPRGAWHFFPNQIDYAHHVPSYDAFPSGHLAAAMATVTVIAGNYPEYSFVRPVGYTLMGVLGFQMLNNGVHWASDYPLGIALGYGFGRIAVQKGQGTYRSSAVQFQPLVFRAGAGVRMTVAFSSENKKKG
jgi:hypothetical protein